MPETNSTPKQTRRLRNFLISPRFQMKYVFWLSITGLVLSALQCALFYKFTRENYTLLVDLAPMTDEVKQQLYRELNQILIYLGATSVLFIAVSAILGMVISHGAAGPMYHFKRVFDEIRRGDRNSRVNLRPGDDFKDVARSFNEMMDQLTR